MALHELHPFQRGEIAKLPQKPGVYVLFQIEVAIHADGARNLRRELRAAKAKFPAATHFAVETPAASSRAIVQRVRQLRKDLSLVRTVSFMGSAR